ncbi:ABC transporter permease [Occallatibacter riparius]|uniref:ABC transporter permease n=1 Tax=Occallatibacter riparius TaxID=1002689 RepID=A0A9J7BU01_9BACT|nr:ABC transporter permease [Occallatibacter riparius]UWZ84406.1 ABC transporter permease [Occallatibacter riparius]
MSEPRELWRRVRMLFHRRRFQADLEEEMRLHLELRTQEHAENGLSAEAARRMAYRKFGNPTVIREKSYKAWGWEWLESLVQDVRFALRQLWKTPGFTVTAILTLALGIGANSAIFTLVNAVLLKDLPVVDPQSLVRLGDSDQCCVNRGPEDGNNYSIHSTDTWHRFQKNPEFEELAAMQAGLNALVVRREHSDESAHSVNAEFVSGNYFHMFGLRTAAGRLLQNSDDVQGAPATAVMSYALWERDYERDPSVVGSIFRVNTNPVTIVGIAPEQFYGDRMQSTPPAIYLPIESMSAIRGKDYVDEPEARWLYLIGRVKPGTALAQLQVKLSVQLRQMFATNKFFSGAHRPLIDRVQVPLTPGGAGIQNMQDSYRSNLHLLQWIAGLVLLIACANVANLLLVRGTGRRMEMSLRTALGAARARIVRQLLTESVLLALIGGVSALAVSYIGAELLLKLAFPSSQDLPIHATPSPTVLGFAIALSLVTGVLFGVAPAWISASEQPADVLRSGSRTTTGGISVLQRALVVIQAALSLVLLVGAGVFAQSLSKLEHLDLKLDSTNRYIVHFDPQSAGYTSAQLAVLYPTIEDRFHQIPGMVKVGISTYTPMEMYNDNMNVRIQGKPDPDRSSSYVWVNSEYFDSVGTRVVMGRGFAAQDTTKTAAVAVVNQSFLKACFKPGENPIGTRLGGTNSPGDFEIVGVVQDTTYGSVYWKDHSMFFLRLLQRPAGDKKPTNYVFARAIVLETGQPMDNMETLARQTLTRINPNLSVVKFQTFSSQIGEQFTDARMLSRLMTLFGALALLLAAVGLYGVTAYGVERRTSEIGVRMALGAERGSVVAMVLRGAMLQTVIGLAIGVPVAFYGVALVKSQLYEMKTVNSGALAVAIGTLLATACVAVLIPARRAASVDPARALRQE